VYVFVLSNLTAVRAEQERYGDLVEARRVCCACCERFTVGEYECEWWNVNDMAGSVDGAVPAVDKQDAGVL
jgi:hypothetical protein